MPTVDLNYLLALLTFCAVASITPGPNNLMIMSSGLNFGLRASMPHLLGINLGFCLMVLLVGLGLSSVFSTLPQLHQVIKVAGLLYLLWLAWKIAATRKTDVAQGRVKALTFWQAAAFQWVNAKAWVMITGAVTAFTTVGGELTAQVWLITAIFLLVGLPSTACWLLGGHLLAPLLQSDRASRRFNQLMGALLALSTLPVLQELAQALPI